MQIVIDIDEKIYNEYMNLTTGRIPTYKACDIAWVLKNGTILPKGHGDLIDRNSILCDDCVCPCGHADECFRLLAPTIIEADK